MELETLVTRLQITHRPAAGVGVTQNQTSQVCTVGLGAARAIAERNVRHACRDLAPLGITAVQSAFQKS